MQPDFAWERADVMDCKEQAHLQPQERVVGLHGRLGTQTTGFALTPMPIHFTYYRCGLRQ